MTRFVRLVALVLSVPAAWLLAATAIAGPQVQVKGLFANRAILEINGEDRLVKTGELTAEGVLLVSSNSREAVVEVDGIRQTLTLTRQIASEFTDAERKEVRIPKSVDSHYRVSGTIEGHPVEMLVDTGATTVVMNSAEAERLGIDYRRGQKGQATTASGVVTSYLVDINQISVAGIDVHNIKGAVIVGEFPQQVLLGNTFLTHVSMEQEANELILRSKF